MATFKTEIRKHQQREDGSYNVKLRITHKRRSRWLPTNIDITPHDLTARGKIKTQAVLDKCEDLLRRVRADVSRLSPFALEEMDVEQVAEWVRKEERGEGWRLDFFEWGRQYVAGMSDGARGHYTRALNALARYLGTDKIDINDLRASDIRAFGAYLDEEPKACSGGKAKKRGGVSKTYISALAHLHALARAQFNDADAERQLIPRNPFDGYKAPPAPRMRGGQQSLGIAGIQALIDARPEVPEERQAIALFLLSFCLMGANLADLYNAPPVSGDWWVYRRKKVEGRKGRDAEIRVRVPSCALPLLAEFPDRTGRYWMGLREWSNSVNNCTAKVNRYLRQWQAKNGMRDFTFYAARHSWSTIAHGGAGFNRDTIDEAMGHNGNLPLTDIYIEKDWEMLNRVNAGTLALFDWSKPR